MQQAHRSRPTVRRLSLILAPFAGAAAVVLAAGPAAAESLSRGGFSTGPSTSTTSGPQGGGADAKRAEGPAQSGGNPGQRGIVTHGEDHTGLHDSDPFGYLHTDMNPVLQNQHPRATDDFSQTAPQPLSSRAGNPAGWTQNWNDDGTGYTVCPALASHC
ncbi:hypothetical protein ACFXHA_37555 [Nocardia sp. NPDC059240]|uniref:hypothetical protein n=1 Tax=Nocardia sp. NPDC059240 TaxID=3346786 RepID=UPI003677CC1C